MVVLRSRALVAAVVVASLAGCSNLSATEERVLSGGAMGAVGGAAVGALTGGLGVGAGAAIGGAIGAAAGYVVDRVSEE